METEDYLDLRIDDFLDRLTEGGRAPGGGSAAALAVAFAAGLVAMVARCSRESWDDAAGVAAQSLAIKERDHPFGVWRLHGRQGEETVKVSGALSTNHGEIALRWAIEGAGIVLRSRWDAQPYIDAGRLVQVLPDYTQEANVWAVYPQRLSGSGKLRVCVEFLARYLMAPG